MDLHILSKHIHARIYSMTMNPCVHVRLPAREHVCVFSQQLTFSLSVPVRRCAHRWWWAVQKFIIMERLEKNVWSGAPQTINLVPVTALCPGDADFSWQVRFKRLESCPTQCTYGEMIDRRFCFNTRGQESIWSINIYGDYEGGARPALDTDRTLTNY